MQCYFSRSTNRQFYAPDFGCKHTKTKAIYCNVLGSCYKKPVIWMAQAAIFNLLCDESNDKVAPIKLLIMLVHFFVSIKGVLATRHLDTVAVIDLMANGIFAGLESTLKKYVIPFINMLNFTSYTCIVTIMTRKGVISYLCKEQPKAFDAHRTSHAVSLSVKATIKRISVLADELLVDIYYHFHHSAKRIEA